MMRETFIRLLRSMQQEEIELNLTKGKEYAMGDDDALRNFKLAGVHLGLTPLQVCMVYMHKHYCALIDYAREGESRSSEPLYKRVADLRLYAVLFLALAEVLEEEEHWSDATLAMGEQ